MKIDVSKIKYDVGRGFMEECSINISIPFTGLYNLNEYALLLRKKTLSFFGLFGNEKTHVGKNGQILGYTYTSPLYKEDQFSNATFGTKTSIHLLDTNPKIGFSGKIFIKGTKVENKAKKIEEAILKISEVIQNEKDDGLQLIVENS